ncbi:phage tail tape measure protein [Alphaproteobacteria bacterium KMM 3653]|uniref:Phage tail tape measure protein n=1 Tax=Harenicola maris TaxID=2841044 RepID=A0AAP2G3Q3_9RHOB|nr:phage tail tape measure protein [Harenicola maris]
MDDVIQLDELDAQLEALEDTLGGAGTVAAQFDLELSRMQASLDLAGQGVGKLSGTISSGLSKAFEGLAFDGMKLSDALKTVANSIISATYTAAMKPVTSQLGSILGQGIEGLITGGSFAKGGAFTQGRVQPFAKGGVVTSPTTFPMRGGTGLMGEAGAEAIMPLARGADGSLGVRTQGSARPINVTMNISTPDAAGFERSRSQIAAQMGRALSRGQRNR